MPSTLTPSGIAALRGAGVVRGLAGRVDGAVAGRLASAGPAPRRTVGGGAERRSAWAVRRVAVAARLAREAGRLAGSAGVAGLAAPRLVAAGFVAVVFAAVVFVGVVFAAVGLAAARFDAAAGR
ncbi:hypothetical protein [Blastochloris viridis]|uniref:hypothetical protein n=1 Tax=Blastochloris viridis TaxID=1079 RepID=UPI0011A99DAC|nr:hypothetical protein [Blastochloris viridis]